MRLVVGSVEAEARSMVRVPVWIQGAGSIRAFSFDIVTNFDLLQFREISTAGSLSEQFSSLVGVPNAEGGITVAGFAGGAEGIPGNGILLYLDFEVMVEESGSVSVTLGSLLDDLQDLAVEPGAVMISPVGIGDWAYH